MGELLLLAAGAGGWIGWWVLISEVSDRVFKGESLSAGCLMLFGGPLAGAAVAWLTWAALARLGIVIEVGDRCPPGYYYEDYGGDTGGMFSMPHGGECLWVG